MNPVQTTLFPTYEQPAGNVRQNVRQKHIDAALERANELWRERYTQFIPEFLAQYGPATAEEIRLAYEERRDLPKTKKQQGSGGIFQKLAGQGVITEYGQKRSVVYGNNLTVWKLK